MINSHKLIVHYEKSSQSDDFSFRVDCYDYVSLFCLIDFHRSCIIDPEEFVHGGDDSLLVLLAFGLLLEIVIIDGCIFYRFDLSQILYHKIA